MAGNINFTNYLKHYYRRNPLLITIMLRLEKISKKIAHVLRRGATNLMRIFNSFQKTKNVDQLHAYSKFSISLPAGHPLPINQRQHKLYDRFLPHLAKHLNNADLVVDVGANVGDTAASMLDANPELEFICIEPDDIFFSYLNKNAKTIRNNISNSKIDTLKQLVGKNITNVKLVGAIGSRHSVEISGKGLKSIQLDTILAGYLKKPRLIKCDVDGFDWDVLESASNTLQTGSTIIFFECEYTQLSQAARFKKIISSMSDYGYHHWRIFDNFGNFLLKTDDTHQIFSLMNYVWRQNFGGSSRTIWYFDLLACKIDEEAFLEAVVDKYCQQVDRLR
ncbi:FkbM family methyltransferase [Azonexus sp. IMCC34842]|uniref:FkbM family methyltransferase n=1 Tax=Azonexus sp. IMCC34842 TaxID=3420950 RepID=UPI003D0B33F1